MRLLFDVLGLEKWPSNKTFASLACFFIAHCKLRSKAQQTPVLIQFCCDSAQSGSTSFSRVVTRFEIFSQKYFLKIFVSTFFSFRLVIFRLADTRKNPYFLQQKASKPSIGTPTRAIVAPRPRTCALVLKVAFLCCCFVAGSLECQLFFSFAQVLFFYSHFLNSFLAQKWWAKWRRLLSKSVGPTVSHSFSINHSCLVLIVFFSDDCLIIQVNESRMQTWWENFIQTRYLLLSSVSLERKIYLCWTRLNFLSPIM